MIVINNEISYYSRQNDTRDGQQVVRWFVDNLLHRDNGEPAYIRQDKKECWECGHQVFLYSKKV